MMDPNIQAALITAGGTLLVAGLGVLAELLRRQGKHLALQDNDLAHIRHQVANSHPTNLRDDVDSVLSGLRAVHGDVTGLREDLRVERRERMSLSDRFDDYVRRGGQ